MSFLIGILGLGLVVFFHELGHLLGAKAMGIEVELFSLGWGKKLFGKTWKNTEYRLSLLPLGGYCKMKGEKLLQGAMERGETTIPREPGSLFGVSPPRRIFTYLAGPLGNLVFSILVLTLVWQMGFTIYTYPGRIVLADDYPSLAMDRLTPAAAAGLKTGDVIVAVDDESIHSFEDLRKAVAPHPQNPLTMKVRRNSEILSFEVTPELSEDTGMGRIGVSAWIDPILETVKPGSAAELGGVEPGDRILSVNGTDIAHQIDFIEVLRQNPGKLSLEVERNGSIQELTVIPHYNDGEEDVLGISFKGIQVESPKVNPFQALSRGIVETMENLKLSVSGLLSLTRSEVSMREAVSGPIRITYYLGETAHRGFSLGFRHGSASFLRFLSFISLALFLMNLLPIPLLDGGMILANLFVWISRRPLRPRPFYWFQMAGFLLLLMLILFATYGDILFLLGQ